MLSPAQARVLMPRLPSLVPRHTKAVATPRTTTADGNAIPRGNSLIDYEALEDELPQYDPGIDRAVELAISTGMFKPRHPGNGNGRRFSMPSSTN